MNNTELLGADRLEALFALPDNLLTVQKTLGVSPLPSADQPYEEFITPSLLEEVDLRLRRLRYPRDRDKGIRRFQEEAGLKTDGIVGPKTWETLGHLATFDDGISPTTYVQNGRRIPALERSILWRVEELNRLDGPPPARVAEVDSARTQEVLNKLRQAPQIGAPQGGHSLFFTGGDHGSVNAPEAEDTLLEMLFDPRSLSKLPHTGLSLFFAGDSDPAKRINRYLDGRFLPKALRWHSYFKGEDEEDEPMGASTIELSDAKLADLLVEVAPIFEDESESLSDVWSAYRNEGRIHIGENRARGWLWRLWEEMQGDAIKFRELLRKNLRFSNKARTNVVRLAWKRISNQLDVLRQAARAFIRVLRREIFLPDQLLPAAHLSFGGDAQLYVPQGTSNLDMLALGEALRRRERLMATSCRILSLILDVTTTVVGVVTPVILIPKLLRLGPRILELGRTLADLR